MYSLNQWYEEIVKYLYLQTVKTSLFMAFILEVLRGACRSNSKHTMAIPCHIVRMHIQSFSSFLLSGIDNIFYPEVGLVSQVQVSLKAYAEGCVKAAMEEFPVGWQQCFDERKSYSCIVLSLFATL
ncbi:hypothetical protein J6590_055302 [Homalodisca vitripennis]|nr:hypothetical protein J6590_055302 [Homalodisca vitripennis]